MIKDIKINIPYGQNDSECMIKIYDILGNRIFSKTLQTGMNKINLFNIFSSGVLNYTITGMHGHGIKTGKLIITI